MSKFWQKKYISKYTGAEIDAAVAKAGTVPAVTEADAGKALVVDEEGKIVAGGDPLILDLAANQTINFLLVSLESWEDKAKKLSVNHATFASVRALFADCLDAILANPQNPNIVIRCRDNNSPVYCNVNSCQVERGSDFTNIFFSFSYSKASGSDDTISTHTFYFRVHNWTDTETDYCSICCQTYAEAFTS